MEPRRLLAGIASGETVTTTVAAGQQNAFTFAAAAGDYFQIDDTDNAGTSNASFQVRAPDGSLAVDGGSNWISRTASYTVPAGGAGTYTIIVKSSDSTKTASFDIEMLKLPGARQTDREGSGGAIVSGQTLTDSIDRPGDFDEYTFAAAAGDYFQIDDTDNAGTSNASFQVRAPDGSLAVDGGSNWISRTASYTVPAGGAGTYTIIVKSSDSTKTASFDIEMLKLPGARQTDREGSGGAIVSGQTLTDSIDRPGDFDEYTFAAAAGDYFQIDDTDNAGTSNASFQVRAPDGSLAVDGGSNWISRTASYTVPAGGAGTYTIIVKSSDSTKTASFDIEMLKLPGARQTDREGSGGAIVSGQTLTDSIDRPGDFDEYTFAAAAGDYFQIDDTDNAGTSNASFQVRAPDGSLAVDGGSNWISRTASYTVPAGGAGTYTIIVKSSDSTKTASFAIHLGGIFLSTLAHLSQDVYSSAPAGYDAYTPYSPSVDTMDLGYKGEAYSSDDGSEIIIAFRGSVFDTAKPIEFLKSVAADVSFSKNNTSPTVELRNQVSDAARFVASIANTDPDAEIILTGHSLGGAIAQLVGKASRLYTISFNAPGAAQLYANLSNELQPADNLRTSGVDVNYRLQGDQVSLFGTPIGTTVKLIASQPSLIDSINPINQFVAVEQQYGNLHAISTVIATLESNRVVDSNAGDEANFAAPLQSLIQPNAIQSVNPFYKTYKFLFNTANQVGTIDPDNGNDFLFSADAGSPLFSSIELPQLAGIVSYSIRYKAGGAWSSYQPVFGGKVFQLPQYSNAIEFVPVDALGKAAVIADSFFFNTSFSNDGTFSGQLTAQIFSTLAGTVYFDANGNGTKDATEKALAGVRVFNDVNNNGVLDSGEKNATTDTAGNYNIVNLPPGAFRIRHMVPAGYKIAVPSAGVYTGTLGEGQNGTGKNFGDALTTIVIDDAQATKIGTWSPSTTSPGFYGSGYITDANADKGNKSVTFTPSIVGTGVYKVLIRYPAGTNRASNVPIDIKSAGGTSTVIVNQQLNNNAWVSLGTYTFNAGTGANGGGSVTLRTTGTNGYVIADAVEFVPLPDIVVDNTQASLTGSWTTSTTEPNFIGTNYLSDGNAGKGTKSVKYTPYIPAAGNYAVYGWWETGGSRATNARYDIMHNGITDTVLADQSINGSRWVLLGTYAFAAGSGGSITLRNDSSNGYVIADAVRFAKV